MTGVTVRIGSVAVGLEVHPRRLLEAWLPWLERFATRATPAARVVLREDDDVPLERFLADLEALQGLGAAGSSPAGAITWRGVQLHARIPPRFLELERNREVPRVLNIFLCAAFNALRGRTPAKEVLFHGCAVFAGDGVVVFTGPSGAGKSTIARLAGESRVLHDEGLVLRRTPAGEIEAGGTPLVGSFPGRVRGVHPVRRILALAHGSENRLDALSPFAFVRFLLPQFFRSTPPFPGPEDLSRDLETRLAWAVDVASRVPGGRLRFLPGPDALRLALEARGIPEKGA